MKTHIDIDAPGDAVWPYLADPVMMSAWNPKVIAVDRDREGEVREGERFSMLYRMSGNEVRSAIEVVAFEPRQRVVYRHRFTRGGVESTVDETVSVSSRDTGVRVIHAIDLRRSGIPWFFRALIWLIDTFGRSTGPQPLDTLKQMIEDRDQRPAV